MTTSNLMYIYSMRTTDQKIANDHSYYSLVHYRCLNIYNGHTNYIPILQSC